MLALQPIKAADAIFELASVVIAVSAWRLRRAAYLCKDTHSGIDSSHASQVPQPVCSAAFAWMG